MGAILAKILGNSSSTQSEDPPFVIEVDFEAAKPIAEESAVYQTASEAVERGLAVLESLRGYAGCSELIKKAISDPKKENEDEAWASLIPSVTKLREYYEFALKLDEVFQTTFQFLCNGSPYENTEKYQATGKKFADILHIASRFDEIKVSNPNIQNDFSYYRRTLSKMRMTNPSATTVVVVNDELANRMSLFYAESSPMTKILIESTKALSRKGLTENGVSEFYAIMAAVCFYSIRKNPSGDVDYFLRVMILSIILFDHVNTAGAFCKGSKINIRASVKCIQNSNSGQKEGLMNSLKYSTKHLNDETTPKNVKALFA